MEREEGGKQSPHKTPHTQIEEVGSDSIQEARSQEQDPTFTTFATLESESGSSSFEDDEDEDEDEDDADFFLSQEFEADLQFPESEGSNYDKEMEEFDVVVDELTYEELILLGDFIGKEKRGLSANEISSCLRSYACRSAERKSEIDRCVICQVEFGGGEATVALPCEHPYHTDCISKWLQIKKVCPMCSSEISVPKDP